MKYFNKQFLVMSVLSYYMKYYFVEKSETYKKKIFS